MPPVSKDDDNHLLDKPDIFLDEIMRQAAESEIIQLTMKIRNNEPINLMQGNEVQIIKKESLTTGMLMWADQVICATNNSRIALNKQMRDLLGRGERPEDGDKVICLRNYWSEISEDNNALVNGTIGTLKNSYESFIQYPAKMKLDTSYVETINGDFVTDGDDIFNNLRMDKKNILEGVPTLSWKDTWKIGKSLLDNIAQPPLEFTYGYAITRS